MNFVNINLKASPLPPAPLATSGLLICRLKWLMIGRNRKTGFQDWNQWINMKYINLFVTCLIIGFCWFFAFFYGPQMTILGTFGGPWAPFCNHFTIKWVTDALRGSLEGPRVDFSWFLMDFGFPFGDNFGSLFDIFCHLKRQKACLDCRHDYCWLWIENLQISDVPTFQFIT